MKIMLLVHLNTPDLKFKVWLVVSLVSDRSELAYGQLGCDQHWSGAGSSRKFPIVSVWASDTWDCNRDGIFSITQPTCSSLGKAPGTVPAETLFAGRALR